MAAKANAQAKKGLPDRARDSHPKHAKRMGHKARAQVQKAKRRAANDERARINAECRAAGILTPAQERYNARRARRKAQK